MDQNETRIWLIQQLLDEDQQYSTLQIPDGEQEQKDLLRALMNVRPAKPISSDFLSIQDAYLQRENETFDVHLLKPIKQNSKIYLWQGDITTLTTDAIVNPANSALEGCFQPLHNCLDNLIHSKAGIQLRLDCHAYMQKKASQNEGFYEEPTGQAMITSGYNLPCSYVIHTVGPIVRSPLNKGHKRSLASCYSSILELADQKKLETLALCCISTGVFMFPQDKAAEVAVETVCDWLESHPQTSLKKIIFNVFKPEDYHYYDNLLN